MNPNSTIDPLPSFTDRYTAKLGTTEDGNSHLEPWHKLNGDYYIANDAKEVFSTFDGGYYYPETPLELVKDPDAMKQRALEEVNKLYGPALARLHLLGPVANGAPTKIWQVFLRVKKFSVEGTWGVHVFLGEPPANSLEWYFSENRVGTVNILATHNIDGCSNCQNQAASGQLVTGSVSLTGELVARELDLTNTEAVVEYLTNNLTWRVAKVRAQR
jgi:tyrosinase